MRDAGFPTWNEPDESVAELVAPELERPRTGRKWKLPLILFVATCVSTFWVGITNWQPTYPIAQMWGPYWVPHWDFLILRRLMIQNWDQGLIYMGCVLAILLTHELGHFIATIIYRVPATAPIFLPFPFNPIGTLGAVIGMQGTKANRPQIFDIGIAGPLAGLVVAIPIAIIGIKQLDLAQPAGGELAMQCPLAFQWMIEWMGVPGYDHSRGIALTQLNPYFAAAWVGFLVTGLNMIPIGQLDGGHITYTLFGRNANRIAQGVIVIAIAFMVYTGTYILVLMTVLVLLMGTEHPPTSDDTVPIGRFRTTLGLISLSIPLLCFPPLIFIFP